MEGDEANQDQGVQQVKASLNMAESTRAISGGSYLKNLGQLCPAPRLKAGQKLNLNVFGRTFKIIAGEDEDSTIVRELRRLDTLEEAKSSKKLGSNGIVVEQSEGDSAESKSLNSD